MRKLAEAGDPRLLKIIKRCMWGVAAVLAGLALVAVFYAGMLKQVATTVKGLSLPSVAVLEGAMQERTLGRMELVQPGQRTEELRQVRKQTDVALHNMRNEMPEGLLADLLTPGEVKQRTNELNAALAELPKMRQQADNHQASPEELYTYYNRLIDSGSVLFGTQADEAGDRKAGHGGRVATELFMAADRYSRAASVVSMGLATEHLSPADYREFTEQRAAFRYAIDMLIPRSTPEVQQKYAALTRSREWRDLATVERTVIEHGPWGDGRNDRMPAGLPDPARWSQLTNQVITDETVDLAVTQSTSAANLGAANADRNFWLALAGFIVVLGVATGIARGTSYNVRLAEERAQHLAEVRQGHQRVSEKNARELSPLITEIIRRLNRFAKDHGTRQDLVDWSYGMLRLGTRVRRIAHNEAIAAGGLPVNEYRKPLELEEALHAARAETTGPEQVQVADRIPDVRLRARSEEHHV